jgi:pimeloyl-ACP methyl ester carboxylesterase
MLKAGSIVTKFILVPIILGLFGVLFILLLIREYRQFQIKRTTSFNTPESIDSLERVTIGGMTQWIYLRGKNKHNPVLLFLQDGYGIPMIYRARNMSVSTGLENDFVMVFWDKRGEGKSRHSRLTQDIYQTENYVSDVGELAAYLTSRFKTPKIFLMGHSGGSEIGIKSIKEYPELFYAYIGVGQVVDLLRAFNQAYDWALAKAKCQDNQQALNELNKLGKPPYTSLEQFAILEKWKNKFGGMIPNKKLADSRNQRLLKQLIVSPDYTLKDIWYVLSDLFWLVKLRAKDICATKITETITDVKIPVYFLQGDSDIGSPPNLLQEYVSKLRALQGKKIIIFKNCGHYLFDEQPKAIGLELRNIKIEVESDL